MTTSSGLWSEALQAGQDRLAFEDLDKPVVSAHCVQKTWL